MTMATLDQKMSAATSPIHKMTTTKKKIIMAMSMIAKTAHPKHL